MEIEEKRKLFLDQLNKIPKRYLNYSKSIGPGLLNKLKRLFYAPDIYIPHLLFKLGFVQTNGKEAIRTLLGDRKIRLKLLDEDSYFFAKHSPVLLSEINLIKFFIKNLEKTDIFYDIGANYGFYTYLALEFCKEIHAFEPIPHVFNSLKENLNSENKVFLNNIALLNKNGNIDFYLDKRHTGLSSVVYDIGNQNKISSIITVESLKLDEYVKNHNKPTVLKIDVEGAEKLVIEGGLDFFKKNNPIISMEVWSSDNNLSKLHEEAINLLKSLGYKSYFIDDDGNIKEVNADLPLFTKQRELSFDNYIFKK